MVYQNPLYWKISITHLLCFHKALCFFCQFNMLEWFIRIPYCVFKFPYSWEHYQFAENVPNPGGWLFSIGDFDKPFAIYLNHSSITQEWLRLYGIIGESMINNSIKKVSRPRYQCWQGRATLGDPQECRDQSAICPCPFRVQIREWPFDQIKNWLPK